MNIFSGLTPVAQSGWKGACTRYFLPNECVFLSFAGFSSDGVSAFSAACIAAIPAQALASAGLVPSQVAQFGMYTFDGKACQGFSSEQLKAVSVANFYGWQGLCVANLLREFFEQHVELDQALSMSSGGLNGLTTFQLNGMLLRFGNQVVDGLTAEQLSQPGLNQTADFILSLYNQNISAFAREFCVQDKGDLSGVTWLQVALSSAVALRCLTPENVVTVPNAAIEGFRPDQMQEVAVTAYLSALQVGHLSCLVIPRTEASAIVPSSFPYFNWAYMEPQNLTQLTLGQLVAQAGDFADYLGSLPCPIVRDAPLSFFVNTLVPSIKPFDQDGLIRERYDKYRKECVANDPTMPSLACSGFVKRSGTSPTSSPVSTTPFHAPGDPVGLVIGVIVSSVAAAGLLVALLVIVLNRNRRAHSGYIQHVDETSSLVSGAH